MCRASACVRPSASRSSTITASRETSSSIVCSWAARGRERSPLPQHGRVGADHREWIAQVVADLRDVEPALAIEVAQAVREMLQRPGDAPDLAPSPQRARHRGRRRRAAARRRRSSRAALRWRRPARSNRRTPTSRSTRPIGASPSASISRRSRSSCCGARRDGEHAPRARRAARRPCRDRRRAPRARPRSARRRRRRRAPSIQARRVPAHRGISPRCSAGERRAEGARQTRTALAGDAIVDARDHEQPDRRQRERDDDRDGNRQARFERQMAGAQARAHERLRGGTPAPTRSRSDPTGLRPRRACAAGGSRASRRCACAWSPACARPRAGGRPSSAPRPGSRASSSSRSYSRPESGSSRSRPARPASGRLEQQLADADVGVHAPAACEQRVHARDQLGQGERLAEVVVGSAVEAAQHVDLLGARGQDEHGRPAVEPVRAAAQAAQDVESRSVREPDVDHRDVGHEVVQHAQRLPQRAAPGGRRSPPRRAGPRARRQASPRPRRVKRSCASRSPPPNIPCSRRHRTLKHAPRARRSETLGTLSSRFSQWRHVQPAGAALERRLDFQRHALVQSEPRGLSRPISRA